MLRRLKLKNYRAFEDLDIKLSKINLFFGPNNAGKSAILSSINLLAQTIASADMSVPLLLNGNFEDLGSYVDIVYGNQTDRNIGIGIELDVKTEVEENINLSEGGKASRKFRFQEKTEIGSLNLSFFYKPRRRNIELASTEIKMPLEKDRTILATRAIGRSERQLIEHVDKDFKIPPLSTMSRVIRFVHFIPALEYSRLFRLARPLIRGVVDWSNELEEFSKAVTDLMQYVEFVSPFRTPALRVYTFSGESPSTVGIHGDKAVDVLSADHLEKSRKRRRIAENVSEWLRRAEIARSINTKLLSQRHFEIRVVNYHSGESENLADVSYGCSQVLPILVAGLRAPEGGTLIIEQPEIHLHPKAQAELGSFLYDLSKRELQLFIETHSEHLLLRLQSHIAKGEIRAEDVSVYYVYGDTKEERKKAVYLPIGKDGIFVEEWPEGFFPERLREAKRLAGLTVN